MGKKFKPAVIILSFFVVLLCPEIYFKYCGLYDNGGLDEIFQGSSTGKLLYELKPDAEIVFTGLRVKLPRPSAIKISSKGVRDYEYTLKKAKDTYRIILLGDSVAFGWGVDLEQTFAKREELYFYLTMNDYI